MHDDHQRRQLPVGGGRLRVGRRVDQRVSLADAGVAGIGREGHVLGAGEPGRVQSEVARRAQDLRLPAVDVDPQDHRLAAPGRRDAHHRVPCAVT